MRDLSTQELGSVYGAGHYYKPAAKPKKHHKGKNSSDNKKHRKGTNSKRHRNGKNT